MMADQLTIILPETASAEFERRDVILLTPTSEREYLAWLQSMANLHDGLAAMKQVLAKLRAEPGQTPGIKEGLKVLSDILPHMIGTEEAMQRFYEPSCAIHNPGRKGRAN